jgi:hypothetical protein
MRWVLLISGLLVSGGCASIPQVRYDRIAKRLKFWKNSGESQYNSSPPNHGEERGAINWLNSLVGNSSDDFPRGTWSK